jgi:hypothetical protein
MIERKIKILYSWSGENVDIRRFQFLIVPKSVIERRVHLVENWSERKIKLKDFDVTVVYHHTRLVLSFLRRPSCEILEGLKQMPFRAFPFDVPWMSMVASKREHSLGSSGSRNGIVLRNTDNQEPTLKIFILLKDWIFTLRSRRIKPDHGSRRGYRRSQSSTGWAWLLFNIHSLEKSYSKSSFPSPFPTSQFNRIDRFHLEKFSSSPFDHAIVNLLHLQCVLSKLFQFALTNTRLSLLNRNMKQHTWTDTSKSITYDFWRNKR